MSRISRSLAQLSLLFVLLSALIFLRAEAADTSSSRGLTADASDVSLLDRNRTPPALAASGSYAGGALSIMDICIQQPDERGREEAAFLHSPASPFTTAGGSDEFYDSILITCNRKRDGAGRRIEEAIPPNHQFAANLPERIIKGKYGYYGAAPFTSLRYAYPLLRQGGTWIITLPIEFHWPTARSTDLVDLPWRLADELEIAASGQGLTDTGQPCDANASLATGSFGSVEDGLIDTWSGPEDTFDDRDACRVRRDLELTHSGTATTTTALHHLREYWRREIPNVWDDPASFEILPVFVNCEATPAHLHNACDVDAPSEDRLTEWDEANAIWHVRFNLKPRHRPSFTRWALKWNFMYTATPARTVAHELGHHLGLDDEYGEWVNGDVVIGTGNRECDNIFPGPDPDYLMCDNGIARGVYRWIITRRYAVAQGGACSDDSDCGAAEFCAGRGLRTSVCMPTRAEGSRCSADAQCAEGLECRGRPLNGRCMPPRPQEDACQEDSDCGQANFCQRLGVNDCRPHFDNGHTCTRDGQCASGRCAAGFCRPQPECREDADCAAGEFCNTRIGQNRCLSDGSLALGDLCRKNRECATGKCQGRGNNRRCVCADDADCATGQFCNTRLGQNRCLADGSLALGNRCNKNRECATGKCQGSGNDRRCVCADDADCASGQFCNARLGQNRCLADGSLNVGDSCNKNRECATGKCQGRGDSRACVCANDADCPGSQICQRRAGPNRCIAGGLSLGQSCDNNQQCTSGKCQGRGNNRSCVCADDADCPGSQVCDRRVGKNRCIAGARSLGEACNQNQQCATGKCQGRGDDRRCVCASDSDCPGNQRCRKPAFAPNRCE